ncbi:MAG: LamG domain-containing protein, partial [Candidatus Delongbacteria bacterium]|nr:LamG domain-containing protein [Candidatus Delongbacteria bacterium]
NGYHGELVGGATTAGLLHIGDNDQDCALLPSEVFDGLQDFTVSASIRIETLHTSCASGFTPVHTLLNCGTHSLINTFWIGYLPLTHQWLLHIYGNNLIDFFPLPEDVWLHLTFSRNGNQLRLFLDGYLFYNQPASYGGTVEVEPGGAVIGQDQDSFGGMFEACQSLAGGIASLRVYERALSEAEVFQLYLQDRMVLP